MKKKIGQLLLILLLITNNSFGQQSDKILPEATVTEAKVPFGDLPYLKEAFIDNAPSDRKDGISVGNLDLNENDKENILQLAEEIGDKKHGKYDSMLISQKGKLIFESYYLRGRINLPHEQASAMKSYISLLIGRAIQMGYLTMADLDKPLINFLKGLDSTKFVDGVERITLHKAMTMSGGLRFSDEQLKEFGKNNSKLYGINQIQAFFELSAPITQKSQSYRYEATNLIMVIQVLDAVVPGSAKNFIQNELFNKIDIKNYHWPTDPSGLPVDQGIKITSRDMLKLGTLVTNNGQWKGKQLISKKYLKKATHGMIKPTEDWQPENYSYGYFWYQVAMSVENKRYDVRLAWGGGGQRVITIKELDLIIVITGHDRDDTIMDQVSKIILPAFN